MGVPLPSRAVRGSNRPIACYVVGVAYMLIYLLQHLVEEVRFECGSLPFLSLPRAVVIGRGP